MAKSRKEIFQQSSVTEKKTTKDKIHVLVDADYIETALLLSVVKGSPFYKMKPPEIIKYALDKVFNSSKAKKIIDTFKDLNIEE